MRHDTGQELKEISKIDAVKIASDHIEKISSAGVRCALTDMIETQFGWIFFFQSKKYLETKNFIYRLAGNGPITIDKFSGDVEIFGTNSLEIERFRTLCRKWNVDPPI